MSSPALGPAAVDPFAESMAEAAQTAAAAFRLLLTISDAVRRAAQKQRHGQEENRTEQEEKLAPGWAAEALRPPLDPRVLEGLMADPSWPAMAGQLVLLRNAGVDLATFLPQIGQVTQSVYQAMQASQAHISAAGTDRWAAMLRTAMPAGLVRDAILASPAWLDMAAQMALLDRRGVDVAGFLTAAHGQGVGVDRAVAALLAQTGPVAALRQPQMRPGPGCPPHGPPPHPTRTPRPPALRPPPPLPLPIRPPPGSRWR
ncbi:hypothetical protein [Streptomyces sp. NPDC096033]|uniref:hypothetical protein n=1 Tax=Streptomyces sp. NPDC096033 TaxID=3366071 RepID=UPI003806B183